MSHEHAWQRLPDLLADRDEPELLTHVATCYDCQRQLFLLGRVDRLLRDTGRARQNERRRLRRSCWLRYPAGIAAAAAVTLLVTLLFVTHDSPTSRRFTLRMTSGQPIGQATLAPADAGNLSLSLVARGLPARQRGAVYLLWAGGGGPATTVGRFMVDKSGSCQAHFNLPGARSWARFWVTPPDKPTSVVAST